LVIVTTNLAFGEDRLWDYYPEKPILDYSEEFFDYIDPQSYGRTDYLYILDRAFEIVGPEVKYLCLESNEKSHRIYRKTICEGVNIALRLVNPAMEEMPGGLVGLDGPLDLRDSLAWIWLRSVNFLHRRHPV
jgi:hypothetical protein